MGQGRSSNKIAELKLSENEFRSFRDLIAGRSGIYFDPGKQELLKDNLLQRMADCGLSTFADYFNLLSSPDGTKEFDHLLNLITIKENLSGSITANLERRLFHRRGALHHCHDCGGRNGG
jgi:hypothetical protein